MPCRITYKGKEYSSKRVLGEELIKKGISEKIYVKVKDDFSTVANNKYVADNSSEIKIGGFTESEVSNILDRLDEAEGNIKTKLESFADSLNIDIEYIDEMGVDGMANILEGLITIKNNGNVNKSLAEELGHFMSEYFKGQRFEIDSTQIKNTDTYFKFADTYREKYSSMGYVGKELERYVEKEILGKLIGEQLLLKMQGEKWVGTKYDGFIGAIRQMIDRFTNWLKQTDSVDLLMYDMIDAMSNGDISRFTNREFEFGLYYSVGDVNGIEQIESIVKSLKSLDKVVFDGIRSRGGSQAVMTRVRDIINARGKGDGSSLAQYVQEVQREVAFLKQEAKLVAKTPGRLLSDTSIILLNSNYDRIEYIKQLVALINNDNYEISPSQKKTITDVLKTIVNDLIELKPSLEDNITKKLMEKNVQLRGAVNKEARNREDDFSISMDASVLNDISRVVKNFFSYKNTQSSILDFASALVSSANTRAKETFSGIYEKLAPTFYDKISRKDVDKLFSKSDRKINGYITHGIDMMKVEKMEYDLIRSATRVEDLPTSQLKQIYEEYKSPHSVLTAEQLDVYYIAKENAINEMVEKKFINSYYSDRVENYKSVIKELISEGRLVDEMGNAYVDMTDQMIDSFIRRVIMETSPLYGKRIEVYDKYRNSEGKVDFDAISEEDLAMLDKISMQLRDLSGSHNSFGVKKEGDMLVISQIIKRSMDNFYGEDSSRDEYGVLERFVDELSSKGQRAIEWLKRAGSISLSTKLGDELSRNSEAPLIFKDEIPTALITELSSFLNISKGNMSNDDFMNMVVNELNDMKNGIVSKYKKGGEISVKYMSEAEILRLKKIQSYITTVYRYAENRTKLEGVDFIKTDEYYNDYKVEVVHNSKDPNSSKAEFDRPMQKDVWYKNESGDYFRWNGNKYVSNVQPTAEELSSFRQFEELHHDERGNPNFYYKKMVERVNLQIVNGTLADIRMPEEDTIYVINKGKGNEIHYKFSDGRFIEEEQPNKSEGELYISQNNIWYKAKVRPNSAWKGAVKDDAVLNPNYNEEYEGRTIQYKAIVNGVDLRDHSFFEMFGIDKNNMFGKATKNLDLWEARQKLLDNKERDDKALNIKNNYFLLPQVYKHTEDLRYDFSPSKIKETAKAWLNVHIFSNKQDVEEFGEVNEEKKGLSITGAKIRETIPNNYVQRIDPSELSPDILRSYLTYSNMRTANIERARALVDLRNLSFVVKEKYFNTDVKGERRDGDQSNVYKSLLNLIEKNIFSSHVLNIGSFTVGGKTVSNTKFLNTVYRTLSNSGLAYNKWSAFAGGLSGYIVELKERLIEDYGTSADFKRVRSYIKMMKTIQEAGNGIRKDFLMQLVDVYGSDHAKEIIRRNSLSKGANIGLGAIDPYLVYSIADEPHIQRAYALGFSSVRKINGEWVEYRKFMQDMVEEKSVSMSEAKALWDANETNTLYEEMSKRLNERGNIDPSNMEDLQDVISIASASARHIYTQLTGNLSEQDRADVLRNPYFRFMGMFKGFFFNLFQQRFKGAQKNYFSGAEEEGSYRVAWKHKKEIIQRIMTLGYMSNNENLSVNEQNQLKRVQVDMYILLAALSVVNLLNFMADDDDDDNYIIQGASYLANRTYNEVYSGEIFGIKNEMWKMATDPFSNIGRMGENIVGLTKINKTVRSGNYKGMNKALVSFLKLTPMANMYKLFNDDPRASNRWIRREVVGDNVLYDNYFYTL